MGSRETKSCCATLNLQVPRLSWVSIFDIDTDNDKNRIETGFEGKGLALWSYRYALLMYCVHN